MVRSTLLKIMIRILAGRSFIITGAIITIILLTTILSLQDSVVIRPSESDTLVINPLIDNSIQYFCLDEVLYHGHKLTVVYDRRWQRYKMGKGLTVFVDGKKTELIKREINRQVVVGAPIVNHSSKQPVDLCFKYFAKRLSCTILLL